MAVGCLLSLLGVLYPALVAARMQPVEAMRVEQ
jgi:ABC-type antimicrobial peptide transport system permease subunit